MSSQRTRRSLLALCGTAVTTSLGWAATSGSSSSSVSIIGGDNDVPQGQVANYTEMSDTLTTTRGRASVTSGVGLYEINIPSNVDSRNLNITIILTNGPELQGVLANPNAWIEVAIYEEDNSDSAEETIGSGGISVSQDPGENASANLTKERASAMLSPSLERSTLYIAATVKVPGGFPPGQQDGGLEFFIDIRR